MTFINPILAAVGVACVAIPILIHLLMRRRRKPVMWAAMRFLLEAYKEHKRRLRLEQFLLLLARCLLIAFIALGLGRPMLGGGSILGGRSAVTLYLLVDNSLASSATAEGGRAALDRHKADAARLLDQLDATAGDRAGLIALGGPAQAVVAPASADAAAVKGIVEGLRPTDSAADLAGALSALRGILAGGSGGAGGGGTADPSRTVVVILSDFLTGSADTERALPDLGLPASSGVTVLASPPAERGTDNVTILGVDPLRPILIAAPRAEEAAAERTPVTIRARRTGPGVASPGVTSIRVRVAGAEDRPGPPTAQGAIRWAAGESEGRATVDLGAPSSAAGTLVLTTTIDEDPVAGDNTWRRTLEVRPSLRVGVITPRRASAAGPSVRDFEPADWVRIALDPHFGERGGAGAPQVARDVSLVEIDPASVDAARLSGLDAVILPRPDALADGAWRHVRHLADTGGLVLVFPPPQVTVHLWADALVRELGLNWTIAREARVYTEPAAIAPEPARPGEERGLLAMLTEELRELAAPVQVFKALPVESPAGGPSPAVLTLSDGAAFVVAATPGADPAGTGNAGDPAEAAASARGLVVLVTVPASFEWSDLPARPLMVPLMHELVVQGVARSRGDWAAVAGSRPEAPARTTELRPIGEGAPIAVDRAGRAVEPVRHAGLWRAIDDRGAARGLVAVNADTTAGRTDAQPSSTLQSWLGAALGGAEVRWLPPAGDASADQGGGTLRESLDRGQDHSPWAVYLLGAALLVALVELGLARLFSHAAIAPGGGGGAGAGGRA